MSEQAKQWSARKSIDLNPLNPRFLNTTPSKKRNEPSMSSGFPTDAAMMTGPECLSAAETSIAASIEKSIDHAMQNAMENRDSLVLPEFLGRFAGKMDDLVEYCSIYVGDYYVKTVLVEIDDECDLYVTEFGSRASHASAISEAGGQLGNWVVRHEFDHLFGYSTSGLTPFLLPNGAFAGKCPDAKLTILPHQYFGIIEVEVHNREGVQMLRDYATCFQGGLLFLMGIKIFENGSCAVLVWEKHFGTIQLVLQQSIGVTDMTEDSKMSFDVDGGTTHFGIASLPGAPRHSWIRHNVHTGGVAPTPAAPLIYSRDWYRAPLARPQYTVPAQDIMVHINNAPTGVAVDDLIIDAGRIFYSAFKIVS